MYYVVNKVMVFLLFYVREFMLVTFCEWGYVMSVEALHQLEGNPCIIT